jgi:hypothetical protein
MLVNLLHRLGDAAISPLQRFFELSYVLSRTNTAGFQWLNM